MFPVPPLSVSRDQCFTRPGCQLVNQGHDSITLYDCAFSRGEERKVWIIDFLPEVSA